MLEGQYDYPTTPVRTRRLASTDLRAFDVLVLPEGSYGSVLDEGATAHVKQWVEDGGTLIGLGSAVGYLTEAELLASKIENQAAREVDAENSDDDDDDAAKVFESEEDYLKAIEPEEERPDSVAGVLVRAKLDPDHWLNAGMGETVHALIRGSAIYTPLTLDKGQNPAVLLGADELVAGGSSISTLSRSLRTFAEFSSSSVTVRRVFRTLRRTWRLMR